MIKNFGSPWWLNFEKLLNRERVNHSLNLTKNTLEIFLRVNFYLTRKVTKQLTVFQTHEYESFKWSYIAVLTDNLFYYNLYLTNTTGRNLWLWEKVTPNLKLSLAFCEYTCIYTWPNLLLSIPAYFFRFWCPCCIKLAPGWTSQPFIINFLISSMLALLTFSG